MGTIETRLEAQGSGPASRVARFLWEMDEQRRALLHAVDGISPAELGWQPAPGMNTIGMLLAHLACTEAHLGQVGLCGEAVGHAQDVVGITEAQQGLPLAAGAAPSAALAGWDLARFTAALAAAREQTRRIAADLTDADLARTVHRRRPDGSARIFDVGWVFYHLVEHEAGHRAQIALLRHLHRERAPGA